MRHIAGILLILGLLAVFMMPGMAREAAPQVVDETPTRVWPGPFDNTTGTPVAMLPVVVGVPTLTPTKTATPTKTPTPTKTSTPTNTTPPTVTRTGVPGATGLTGRLVFVEPKTNYYTHIEWIKFFEQIRNPTGNPIAYTILGVNVSGPNVFGTNARFHTSWTGGPDYISAGCWGPNGNTDWNTGHRCAPNEFEGWHEDHIGDASNVEIESPGHYWIEFFACLSSYSACTGGGPADWRNLASLQFDAFTPPGALLNQHTATPMPQTQCGLVTIDPDNIYLKCNE